MGLGQVRSRSRAHARITWLLGFVTVTVALLAAGCTITSRTTGTSSSGTRSGATTQTAGAPAHPAAAGLHGLIAYSLAGDIWVMQADGSGRRRVTHAGGNDFDPSLSPDGRRVVFRSSRGHYAPDTSGTGVEGIFVADVDGRNEREIQPPRGGLFPDWSPDGRRIALSTVRADQTETIVTMNPDGTHVQDTGVVGGECAEWSPDGAKIAYCHHSGDGDFEVWVMDADGGHKRQLTDADGRSYPGAWSPDGKRITFSSERNGSFDIFVMDADGDRETRVTQSEEGESPEAWLPDGRIVFASSSGDQPLAHWYVMRADGTGVHSVPQLEGAGDPIDWLAKPS